MNKPSPKNFAQILYGLYALAPIFWVTALVGVIINYLKRDEVTGTWLATHHDWQIRTFWVGLLSAIAASTTLFTGLGWPVMVGFGVWYLYRVVKGWLYLLEDKPMAIG